ncbi:hypothetical protein EDC01DRAFT_645368 [Geopyxis carbonaria]|nr:hypothetical protein EDC01DRAFT_645368 [Geopyxis carbonaria]
MPTSWYRILLQSYLDDIGVSRPRAEARPTLSQPTKIALVHDSGPHRAFEDERAELTRQILRSFSQPSDTVFIQHLKVASTLIGTDTLRCGDIFSVEQLVRWMRDSSPLSHNKTVIECNFGGCSSLVIEVVFALRGSLVLERYVDGDGGSESTVANIYTPSNMSSFHGQDVD